MWGSVSKTCRCLHWVRCHEAVQIVPRFLQEICMTTSVEIIIHHSSALLTTFLIKLNAYLIPVHTVHALHWAETPYSVHLSFPKYICSLVLSNTGGLCAQPCQTRLLIHLKSFKTAAQCCQHHPELLVLMWQRKVRKKYSYFWKLFSKKWWLSHFPWYKVRHAGFSPPKAAFPPSHYQ